MVTTIDGSNTLFSKEYNQHYHNVDDGAINEALSKHVIPALEFHKAKSHLRILDICFGLGYNTFCTLFYILEQNLTHTVEIFTPELDPDLIESLKTFNYPKEFDILQPIIQELLASKSYKSDRFCINLHIADARDYVKGLNNIDIVYQDAFSSEVNKELWTVEYFTDIFNACSNESILTTYSIATPVRLSLYKAGFFIYEYVPTKRKITLAFNNKASSMGKYIDMELKQQRNKEAKPLLDE